MPEEIIYPDEFLHNADWIKHIPSLPLPKPKKEEV